MFIHFKQNQFQVLMIIAIQGSNNSQYKYNTNKSYNLCKTNNARKLIEI